MKTKRSDSKMVPDEIDIKGGPQKPVKESGMPGLSLSKARWILAYFTATSFLIYLDRGTIAGINNAIGKYYDINKAMVGLLGSVFMGGYILGAPAFAQMSRFFNPLIVIGIGLGVWIGATTLAGLGYKYWIILIGRTLTGVGEAALCTLAAPMINEISPEGSKSIWLGIFNMNTLVGVAAGFIYGKNVQLATGSILWPFRLEAILMAPFFLLTFLPTLRKTFGHYNRPRQISQSDEDTASRGESDELRGAMDIQIEQEERREPSHLDETEPAERTVWIDFKKLLTYPTYVCLVLGYAAFTFTFGGLGFWGPRYIENFYHKPSEGTVLLFGAITVVCGLSGAIGGSLILDWLIAKRPNVTKQVRCEQASRVLAWSIVGGFIVGMPVVISRNYPVFIVGLIVSELISFLNTACITVAVLSSVPDYLRNIAMGVNVGTIHLFGDFGSPFLVGVVADASTTHIAMICLFAWLIWACILWFSAYATARHHGEPIIQALCKTLTLKKGKHDKENLLDHSDQTSF